jgi:hypothetical protein
MKLFNKTYSTISLLKKQYKTKLYLIIAFDWVRTSDVPEENGL